MGETQTTDCPPKNCPHCGVNLRSWYIEVGMMRIGPFWTKEQAENGALSLVPHGKTYSIGQYDD